jgi:hypothetical protein
MNFPIKIDLGIKTLCSKLQFLFRRFKILVCMVKRYTFNEQRIFSYGKDKIS